MAQLITKSFDLLRTQLGSLTWAPLVDFSQTTIIALLQRIEVGTIRLVKPDGTTLVCGRDPSAATNVDLRCNDSVAGQDLHIDLRVLKETFWVRVLLFADMGFAESFMLGEFSCSDLTAFFRIFILNRAQLSNATTLTSSLASAVTRLARGTNTLANAQLNISAHYDISNAMFAAFLSEDMTYSCPIWAPVSHSDGKNGSKQPRAPITLPNAQPKLNGHIPMQQDESVEKLEQAQIRKLDYFIDAARIKPTDHVLEIGTGWGSFAIQAVRRTGCRITSLTLSREQKELAEERIATAGYTDNIEILLCDYRALPMPTQGPYDKVVSIEMLEAVGREYLDLYFTCVHKLLKPEGGIGVFQCITMPELRYAAYSSGEDFIRKYIFPGGHLPTVTQLVSSIERGSKGTLVVDAIYGIGGHYARTLRCWREKFEQQFDPVIRPALLQEHQGMTDADIDMFKRKWQYYFTYCEAGFITKTLGDVIIIVGREGAMEMLEGIPL